MTCGRLRPRLPRLLDASTETHAQAAPAIAFALARAQEDLMLARIREARLFDRWTLQDAEGAIRALADVRRRVEAAADPAAAEGGRAFLARLDAYSAASAEGIVLQRRLVGEVRGLAERGCEIQAQAGRLEATLSGQMRTTAEMASADAQQAALYALIGQAVVALPGISHKTAWCLGHRIRAMMAENSPPLSNIVEIDEMYAGAPPRRRAKPECEDDDPPPPDPKGRGTKRPLVPVAAERGGDVAAKVISTRGKEAIASALDGVLRRELDGLAAPGAPAATPRTGSAASMSARAAACGATRRVARVLDLRGTEAEILRRCACEIEASDAPAARARALESQRDLWTALAADRVSPANALAEEIRLGFPRGAHWILADLEADTPALAQSRRPRRARFRDRRSRRPRRPGPSRPAPRRRGRLPRSPPRTRRRASPRSRGRAW